MLSPFNVDYDPSNGSWNVFYIEVYKEFPAAQGLMSPRWEVQPWAFPTLGHAMNFLQPQIASPLAQDKPGGIWSAELRRKSDLGGERVRIGQLILVNK